MNATDRIVEKNEKFWKLLTDSTLTDAEKLKLIILHEQLINEIFSCAFLSAHTQEKTE